MSFYELQAPTQWAQAPSTWSSTTLDGVESCPRRWQLLRSRWGDLERFPVRSHPAAIEGQIVHEALDRLTRACGQRGNPPIGSEAFTAALSDADFFPGFARDIAEGQARASTHPRPGPMFRLRANAAELANRAIRMFREQYKPEARPPSSVAERVAGTVDPAALLRRTGALSELRLSHPTLPFAGVLDRVQQAADGVEIVDFKTGRASESHRRQLLRYALLWWRVTGEAPVRVSAQYLDGASSWTVSPAALLEAEAELARKLPVLSAALAEHPAAAVPSEACRTCPVRARCAPGWAAAMKSGTGDGPGDAELTPMARPGDHGFIARSSGGPDVAVVYEAGVAQLLPASVEGQVLRILDGVWMEKRKQLELKAWTEVFVFKGAGE